MKTHAATLDTTMPRRSLFLCVLIWCLSGSCTPPAQTVKGSDLKIERADATALVVVHSRSGHTAEMGKVLATALNADYIRLDVPSGSGDGYFSTPNRQEEVDFKPAHLDLSRYRLVAFGSPIWYWHATAFIYGFIKGHDLSGKRVILFYTFEGGLDDDAIQEWSDLITSRNGRVIDVIGLDHSELDEGETVSGAAESKVRQRMASWHGR